MREIVFDTETTGLSFGGGDRLVEIGCVEMINRVETGRTFHAYYHPERTMPAEAQAIHGIGDAFLADKPLFADAVEALLDFLGDSPLIAHNAGFDFRSEEHTSELQSLMRISYAVFCLNKTRKDKSNM